MIDDERLQELLSRASSLYNGGEYKAAIDAWQEALSVDPSSQKAREGIRMATLLLGDFDASGSGVPEEGPPPADGDSASPGDLAPEEIEARVDLGMARIKQLMAERKYAEAIEGAQGLQPLNPESEEIHRLLEEAQQAFEATPFIEEHLTLARELLEQERFPEAEEECKKIFVLDATHPAGRALMTQIRDRRQRSLQRAASQLGGMTVKLNLADLKRQEPGGVGGAPAAAGTDEETGGLAGERILDAGEEPSIALAGAPAGAPPEEAHGEAARTQEEVANRSLLDDAFAQAGVGEEPAGGGPADLGGPGFEAQPAAPAAEPQPEEFVEAKTVVPPTVRVVQPAPAKPAPAPSKGKPPVTQAGMKPAAPVPGAPERAAKAATARSKPPATGEGPAVPEPAGGEEVAAWEKELTQLNLKVGERELLKGTGAKAGAAAPAEAEADLMSLLDTSLGGAPGAAAGGEEGANVQSIPLAGVAPGSGASGKAKAPVAEKKAPPAWTVKKSREALAAEAAARAAELASVHERPRERRRPVQPVVKPRSSAGRRFFFLLLLAAGGGGAWWFYLRPGATGLPPEVTGLLSYLRPGASGGAGAPQQPVAPPAGSSSGVAAEAGQGPIPTPIGGPSRPAGQDNQGSAADGASAPAAGPAIAVKPEPIKPAGTPPPLSREELRRRLAYYSSDGRRLMSQGKWREARAKFNAALALDPASFELKELADQVQAKIDEEQHLLDDFASAKQFFADRDYENALRKLYRLPRNRGLGDIDLYIRNAWYNWAVIAAKGGNATDTLKKLDELLQVDPDDADALRLQEVAEHYLSRAKDRVYYAFAEKLRLRTIEQR